MASKTDEKRMANYEALKAYILERGHLPDKHVKTNRSLLSWAMYQRKKIKEETAEEGMVASFEAFLAMRSNEHTGGRRKIS